ncbi:Z-ring formation inhibitor MciZ [Paenibacillus humicola]|uniref:Z-ring formation inhibitor MciZ n=1 Tax=Paenibacillus humicola TaxID=3110540 RepID=UPI00237C4A5C|nr:Z-ring formation inhibitor MciZ [Paenibacillus humicola]
MKQYIAANQMTLVGKAWEIRHRLKTIAKQNCRKSFKSSGTLGDYLGQLSPRER